MESMEEEKGNRESVIEQGGRRGRKRAGNWLSETLILNYVRKKKENKMMMIEKEREADGVLISVVFRRLALLGHRENADTQTLLCLYIVTVLTVFFCNDQC